MNVIVLLACVATVAMVGAQKIIEKDGTKCICRAKTCDDDVSCEEHNCLCTLKQLKILENNKSLKYPKSLVLSYRKSVEKRCRCLKKCEKRCTDNDIEDCIERSWDRFICSCTEQTAQYLPSCKPEEFESFLDDIGKIKAECIKIDCKPQCGGNVDCDPLLADADLECLKDALAVVKEGLEGSIKHLAGELERVLLSNAKGIASCEKHACPMARKTCISSIEATSTGELAGAKSSIIAQLGHCTGNHLIYSIAERIIPCVLKA